LSGGLLSTFVYGISSSITRFVAAVCSFLPNQTKDPSLTAAASRNLPNQTRPPIVISAFATAEASFASPQTNTAASGSGFAMRLDSNPLLQRRHEKESSFTGIDIDDHSKPTNPRTAYKEDDSEEEEEKAVPADTSSLLQRRNTLKNLTRPDPELLERPLGRVSAVFVQ
jgi:hypothetical protein